MTAFAKKSQRVAEYNCTLLPKQFTTPGIYLIKQFTNPRHFSHYWVKNYLLHSFNTTNVQSAFVILSCIKPGPISRYFRKQYPM